MSVQAQDAEMNRAMTKARETIGDFLKRLDHPPASQTYLSLKVRLEEDDVVEHIWLNTVSHSNGWFAGIVGNDPVDLKKIKLGDRVSVHLDHVSDWMAVDGGHLIGGYTLRVLRDRMTPDERKALDQKLNLVFD